MGALGKGGACGDGFKACAEKPLRKDERHLEAPEPLLGGCGVGGQGLHYHPGARGSATGRGRPPATQLQSATHSGWVLWLSWEAPGEAELRAQSSGLTHPRRKACRPPAASAQRRALRGGGGRGNHGVLGSIREQAGGQLGEEARKGWQRSPRVAGPELHTWTLICPAPCYYSPISQVRTLRRRPVQGHTGAGGRTGCQPTSAHSGAVPPTPAHPGRASRGRRCSQEVQSPCGPGSTLRLPHRGPHPGS